MEDKLVTHYMHSRIFKPIGPTHSFGAITQLSLHTIPCLLLLLNITITAWKWCCFICKYYCCYVQVLLLLCVNIAAMCLLCINIVAMCTLLLLCVGAAAVVVCYPGMVHVVLWCVKLLLLCVNVVTVHNCCRQYV